MIAAHLETVALLERCRRAFLDSIKRELKRRGIDDINSVQAYALLNMGEAEMSVGKIQTQCYLGTNVSHTLKQLVKHAYVERRQSEDDARMSFVRLTPKGARLCDELGPMLRHSAERVEGAIPEQDLKQAAAVLRMLASVWRATDLLSR